MAVLPKRYLNAMGLAYVIAFVKVRHFINICYIL